jgi:hypothetical protein
MNRWRGEFTRAGLKKVFRLEDDKERAPSGKAVEFNLETPDLLQASLYILKWMTDTFPRGGWSADDFLVTYVAEPAFDPQREDLEGNADLLNPPPSFCDTVEFNDAANAMNHGEVLTAGTHRDLPGVVIRWKHYGESAMQLRYKIITALWVLKTLKDGA